MTIGGVYILLCCCIGSRYYRFILVGNGHIVDPRFVFAAIISINFLGSFCERNTGDNNSRFSFFGDEWCTVGRRSIQILKDFFLLLTKISGILDCRRFSISVRVTFRERSARDDDGRFSFIIGRSSWSFCILNGSFAAGNSNCF